MEKATRMLIKNSLMKMVETLKPDSGAFFLAEDVLVFLLAAKFIEPAAPLPDKGAVWPLLFDRCRKVIEPLLPWFSEGHKMLPVSDEVVLEFLTGLDGGYDSPVSLLGAVHEATLELGSAVDKDLSGSPARKKQGSYYTPPEITNHMVEISLGAILDKYRQRLKHPLRNKATEEATMILDEIRQLKVIDPACGSAAFLSAVLQELLKFYSELPVGIIDENPFINAVSHLYGTDIDPRAVDLTVLGLFLGCGNCGEPAETEKITQMLRQRIRVGDALAINWQQEFPGVFSDPNPGFALVIGNPPYIPNKLLPTYIKEIINSSYQTPEGQYDIIVPFIEKGLDILRPGGLLCYIVSNKYLAADYGRKLRTELLCRHQLLQVNDLSSLKVFTEASVYPVIQVIKKGRENLTGDITVRELKNIGQLKDESVKTTVSESFFRHLDDMIITSKLNNDIWPVLAKMSRFTGRLPAQKILCGIAKTGFSKAVISTELFRELDEARKSDYRKFLNSGAIDKYSINGPIAYISSACSTKKQWASFSGRKLVIAGMARKIEAAVDEEGCALGRVYYIREEDVTYDLYNNYDLYYLGALFNSSLMDFYYRVLYWPVHLQGGYYRFNSTYLARLPLASEKENPELAGMITKLAVEVHRYKPANQRLIEEIDRLVFELYGLSEKDVAVIKNF